MQLSTPLSVDASTPNGRMALELKGSLLPETNRRPFRYVPFRNQGRNSPFGGHPLQACRSDRDIKRRIRGCRSRVSHFKDPEPCHAMAGSLGIINRQGQTDALCFRTRHFHQSRPNRAGVPSMVLSVCIVGPPNIKDDAVFGRVLLFFAACGIHSGP